MIISHLCSCLFVLLSAFATTSANDIPIRTDCPTIVRRNCTRLKHPPRSRLSVFSDAPISPQTPDLYADGKVIAYICDDGFSLAGCGAVRCTNGSWYCASPGRQYCYDDPNAFLRKECQVATCQGCRAPLKPENGGFRANFGQTNYLPVNSTIQWFCSPGYSMRLKSRPQVYLNKLESKCLDTEFWNNLNNVSNQAESPIECVGCNFTYRSICLNCSASTVGAFIDNITLTFSVGTEVTCNCMNGLVGNSTLTCLENLRWSEQQPSCLGCNPPVVSPNCYITSSVTPPCPDTAFHYPVGAVVEFLPSPGFAIVEGKRNSTCLESLEWSDPCPSCIGCPRPPVDVNCNYAAWRYMGDYFAPGEVVCYQNKIGYSLIGSTCITCQTSGLWSDQPPKCVGCQKPTSTFANGNICPYQASRSTFAVNETVEYCCDQGYSLVTCPSATCQGDTQWSCDNPRCSICDEAPIVARSYLAPRFGPLPGKRAINETVQYFCEQGYTLRGCSAMRCTNDRRWVNAADNSTNSPCPPQCVACAAPTINQDGECRVLRYTSSQTPALEGDKEMYAVGAMLDFQCGHNFRILGNQSTSLTCLESLQWSAPVPRCGGCRVPDTGSNCAAPGRFPPTECQGFYGIGECIAYKPKPGYSIAPGQNATICCQPDGTWTTQPPNCVGCSNPPEMRFGNCVAKSTASADLTYATGTVAQCSCDPGYSFSGCDSSQLTCTSNQTWSCLTPSCIGCGPPQSSPFVSYTPDRTRYQVGTNITFRCEEGFTLSGSNQSQCLANGNWSANTPSCQACTMSDLCACENCPLLKVSYSQPPAPRTVDKFAVGTVATFSCANSYVLNGPQNITCLPNFKWSDSLPGCLGCKLANYSPQNGFVYAVVYPTLYYTPDARTCPSTSTDIYASPQPERAPTEFGVGSRIIFGCNSGYLIRGDPVIECQNGTSLTWSNPPPQCIYRF